MDYHVHPLHSGDTKAAVREVSARALQAGLAEIAFTEHPDFTPTDVSYRVLH